jgi:hypothetical protein
MNASIVIVDGTFQGGEVEPGTFHGSRFCDLSNCYCHKTGQYATGDRHAQSSDQPALLHDSDVKPSSPDAGNQVAEIGSHVLLDDDGTPVQFH